jgi:hypothetical protein
VTNLLTPPSATHGKSSGGVEPTSLAIEATD